MNGFLNSHNRGRRLIHVSLVLIVTLAMTIFIPTSIASAACGSTYTVVSGDNLASIANMCGVTLSALEGANTSISNFNMIFPGQVLSIPAGGTTGAAPTSVPSTGVPSTGGPVLRLSATSGQPGGMVIVGGSGFPASAPISITIGAAGSPTATPQTITSSANGTFTLTVTIPSSVPSGTTYTITAAGQAGSPSASANFTVGSSSPSSVPNTGSSSGTYTVVAGDTLFGIAQRNNTTVDALLAANPSITNRNLIFPGQVIKLSGSTGVPGTGGTGGSGASTYTVVSGDNLSSIAFNNGVSLSSLLQLNPSITNPNLISPGRQSGCDEIVVLRTRSAIVEKGGDF